VWLTGGDNNIFTQIGLMVLVGLACKNAILIVEFARELEKRATPLQAAPSTPAAAPAADPDDLDRLHRAWSRWSPRPAPAPRCATRWASRCSSACSA
jgi:hypothetical protein